MVCGSRIQASCTPTTLTNNVGIGTDSPVNRLHVAGNIQQETGQAIFSNHYYNGEWKAIDESKPGGYINLCDNDGKLVLGNGPGDEPPTQKLVILQSGNVGIGTDSPLSRLSFGDYVPTDGQTINLFEDGNSKYGFGIQYRELRTYCNDLASITFGRISSGDGSTFTEDARIDSDGNVGIGTTGPASKLHVKGSGDATSTNVVPSEYTANIQTDTAFLSIGSENGRPCLQSSGAGTGYHLLLNPFQGNVGIGIDAPAEKLHVNGKVRANDYDLEALPPLSSAP